MFKWFNRMGEKGWFERTRTSDSIVEEVLASIDPEELQHERAVHGHGLTDLDLQNIAVERIVMGWKDIGDRRPEVDMRAAAVREFVKWANAKKLERFDAKRPDDADRENGIAA